MLRTYDRSIHRSMTLGAECLILSADPEQVPVEGILFCMRPALVFGPVWSARMSLGRPGLEDALAFQE
jgi:hypothetical protein